MRKKIAYMVLGSVFLANVASAAQTSYTFTSRQNVVVLNPYNTNINLDCRMSAWAGKHLLNITGINRLTWVNGVKVSPGENITITVANNMKLVLNSEPFAEIRIFNPGESTIVADCSY